MPRPWRRNRQSRLPVPEGALDFAGGTVVHINAAVAGLVGAYMIGKRSATAANRWRRTR
jgi:ammonia channel protein AmtB